jgi:hypothetical protein
MLTLFVTIFIFATRLWFVLLSISLAGVITIILCMDKPFSVKFIKAITFVAMAIFMLLLSDICIDALERFML